MKKIELLAPAGDLNKLKTAIDYGADAVYLGGEAFGLRKASKNFPIEEMEKGVEYAHERGKFVHVTLNIIPHEDDMEGIEEYLQDLERIGVDAVIVADPGMFSRVKKACNIPIHMSTQGSLTSSDSVKFWADLGAERAVLARELSLEEIKKIVEKVGNEIEIETFLHGAMCMSYSGRCLLSNYMTGRDANRGDCSQACRYKYHLVEESRPGEYYPIVQEDEGSFILNSKDLCMIEHVDELIEAGISSLKIEGRVKSEYYLATVVRSYRMAIDAYYADPENYQYDPKYLEEIQKVSHRDFTTGFYYGEAKGPEGIYERKSYVRNYDFMGIVLDYDEETQIATIEQRNRVFVGEEVEFFGPGKEHFTQKIEWMKDENGEEIEVAPRARMIYTMKVDRPVAPKDMLRKKVEEDEK
ncbi:U32 family peptidase [Peptoniphilus sp. KCTC 25270]|uniref:peptidase U32 family protein n=1 Tax=Peptoniphilus sp. KCTC 25270 TaxID=2897414 RepID=UPI001E4911B9|nr:U32 family peptidase [Peptoniphilus sp. KCTC 25270]MCD1147169.1 U32 family peptidase [Peptoniphilus sp. KCTC 25270]